MLDRLLRLLCPDRCILCGKVAEYGRCVCSRCLRALPRREPAPRQDGWMEGALLYEGRVERGVRQFKFSGRREAAAFFAGEMLAFLARLDPQARFDLVACVPMQPDKVRERGYNQAELLAVQVAKGLGIDCNPNLLEHRGGMTQHQQSARMRSINALRSFFPGPEIRRAEGRRILLVDDVLTTGSTFQVCSRLLREAGAARVCALAAGEVPARDFR